MTYIALAFAAVAVDTFCPSDRPVWRGPDQPTIELKTRYLGGTYKPQEKALKLLYEQYQTAQSRVESTYPTVKNRSLCIESCSVLCRGVRNDDCRYYRLSIQMSRVRRSARYPCKGASIRSGILPSKQCRGAREMG